jgi:multiple sugar transport system substrate-binding protein
MSIVKNKKKSLLPDIVQIGSTWSSTLAYLGAIQELTPFITDSIKKDWIPQALESSLYPGTFKVFSVPWFTDIRVLYYRKDILREINMDANSLEDWDSFLIVCREINELRKKGRRIYPLRLSGQMAGILIHDLAQWIWSSGGDFLSVDGRKAIFNQSPTIDSIRWYFDLLKHGYIPFNAQNGVMPTGTFFSGQFAMQFSGMWPVHSYFNKKHPDYNKVVAQNYGIAPVPRGNGGRYTFFGGSNLAVTKYCKQMDEAIELIKFLASTPSQARHSSSIGMFPSTMSCFQGFFDQNEEAGTVFKKSLGFARTLPKVLTLATIEKIIGTMCENILNDIRYNQYSEQQLNEHLNQAAEEADYILSIYE